MDMTKLKMIGGAAAGAVVLAFAGYYYGTSSATPELVAVTNVGCGAATGSGRFEVPLQTVSLAAPTMSVSYGELDLSGIERKLRLNFDRNVDGSGSEVLLIGDTLHLPMTFGRNNTIPSAIRINCRDGQLAGIRYQRDRANTTFDVVHQTISDATPETARSEPAEG